MSGRDWILPIDPEIFELDLLDQEEFEAGASKFHSELIRLLRKHFEKYECFDDESFGWVAHFLVFDQAHELDEFWSAKRVLEDLTKLRTRLNEADEILDRLPTPVSDAFRIGAIQRSRLLNENESTEGDHDTLTDKLKESPHWKAMLAKAEFFRRLRHFVDLIEDAEKAATQGVPVGKKAIEAWRLVAACVGLCERHPGTIKVPKAMNESGPFYRFLSDMFELFDIEELPTSAFRSWRRYVGRKEH